MHAGKLCLGITGYPTSAKDSGSNLSQCLSEILPMVSCIPLTTSALNKALLAPKKDYTTEMLHSGALQLATGTQVRVAWSFVMRFKKKPQLA